MKLNKDFPVIILIITVCLYHYFIQNGLEKIFSETYFNYEDVKRPLIRCSSCLDGHPLRCIGMPSGHAETITILSSLLHLYNFIPFWLCLILILGFSGQRITSKMHTLPQVLAGIFLGYRYALLYYHFNFSIYSFLIVLSIGLILSLLCIYKLDKQINSPIPNWVDKEMIESIKKKQNSPIYSKIGAIYINSLIQNRTFISWKELEKYLDTIVERIRHSGENYDGVVGIKTGGAIISDYISLKLGIPNYKVKLSRSDYNCDKQPINAVNDIIQKNLLNNLGSFTICEGIDESLEGKNVILIDELVSSGKTINETYKYLKNEKRVGNIYATSIALYKKKYKGDIKIDYVVPGTVVIWPWGYDN
jgi:hypoxanthine phosphoribosyltransferase